MEMVLVTCGEDKFRPQRDCARVQIAYPCYTMFRAKGGGPGGDDAAAAVKSKRAHRGYQKPVLVVAIALAVAFGFLMSSRLGELRRRSWAV